jgi:Spx/MgsR family transcriptional regulator
MTETLPTLYGLAKCDTCRKARNWLDRFGVAHRFVDYRDERVPAETLKAWAKQVGGFEQLVNRSGTTWRNLPAPRRQAASDPEWTLLIREYPQLVRRPAVVLPDGAISLGFTDTLFSKLFPDAKKK